MRPTRLALVLALAVLFAAAAPFAGRAQQATPSAASESASPEASPPPIPSPKPAPDDPKRHKLAVQQFLAWQQGQIDRSLYGDEVNSELTDDVLDRGTRTLANMGALQSAVFLGISRAKGADIYVYKMTCEHGSVDMDFALAPDGKIALIFFE
jgi:hypothetical protein